jgi:hypothetical protein
MTEIISDSNTSGGDQRGLRPSQHSENRFYVAVFKATFENVLNPVAAALTFWHRSFTFKF